MNNQNSKIVVINTFGNLDKEELSTPTKVLIFKKI